MPEPQQLMAVSGDYISRLMLAAVRVFGALSLNPMLGATRIPLPARIGLGLFATLVLFPPGTPSDEPISVGPVEIAGELMIGLLAGFAVAIIFGAVQFAANLIGINSGFSYAGTINPMFNHSTGAIESFFSSFALMVFVQINGHHLFLAGLRELFEVVEVGQVLNIPGTSERLIVMTGGIFAAGFKMAFPIIGALLLADFAIGLLARVAPQLNLFTLELPLKIGIGVAAVAVGLPVMMPRMVALFRTLPNNMLNLAG